MSNEIKASFTTFWTFNVIESRRIAWWRKYTRIGWIEIGARIRNYVESSVQLRTSRKLLRRRQTMFKRFEKRRLVSFSSVRRVAESTELFRMLVLWRVERNWQLIWRQPDALARELRDKFEIDKNALEISYERRMKNIVRMHNIHRWRKMNYR